MKFITQTGSIYEIDQQSKKIRRLYGKLPSTERQGLDGEWKTYSHLTDVVVGKPVVIVWEVIESVAKSTVTSVIKDIVDEDKLS